MAPAALMGLDVERLLAGGERMAERCRSADDNPGFDLGTRLGAAASVGLTSHPYTFGLWVEQLIAESTGKHGKGILPVADEPVGTPDNYGDDRVFAHLAAEGGGNGMAPLVVSLASSASRVWWLNTCTPCWTR